MLEQKEQEAVFVPLKQNDSALVSGYGTRAVEMSILKSITSPLKVECNAFNKKKKAFSPRVSGKRKREVILPTLLPHLSVCC